MDLNYDQFNGNTLIFKYNLDEYGNPISIKVDKEEKQVSVHGTIQLEYVPDEYNRVVMLNEDNAQMTEVFNRDEIKPNTYYIDYNNGVAYLDKSQFGKTKIYNYYKKGLQLIGCSRIYDEHDTMGKNVVMTLQEMIDKGKEAIRILIDLGDAYHIITRLEKDIANGTELATRLENDIEVGTPLQLNLHADIVEAKKWKDQLHQDVTDGKVLQPLLQQTVDDAEDVKVRLDKSIADAQEDIATIEATGNKEILIQSSQWTLNGDIYEKEITHDLYSENLHVTAKNSDTKEVVTIGYKILDKSRILLKSDENINMSVILSASYYHATQTISDDIAEEVFKARGGQPQLKDRLDNFDEHLETKVNYFETVASMKTSNKIKKDSLCKTLGYYKSGDGGGAIYRITDNPPLENGFSFSVSKGLTAELLFSDEISIKQLGARDFDDEGNKVDIKPFIELYLSKTNPINNPSNMKTVKLFIPAGRWFSSPLKIKSSSFYIYGINIYSYPYATGSVIMPLEDNQEYLWVIGDDTTDNAGLEYGNIALKSIMFSTHNPSQNDGIYVGGLTADKCYICDKLLHISRVYGGVFENIHFTNYIGTPLIINSSNESIFTDFTFRNGDAFETGNVVFDTDISGNKNISACFFDKFSFEGVKGHLFVFRTDSKFINNKIGTVLFEDREVKVSQDGEFTTYNVSEHKNMNFQSKAIFAINENSYCELIVDDVLLNNFGRVIFTKDTLNYLFDTIVLEYGKISKGQVNIKNISHIGARRDTLLLKKADYEGLGSYNFNFICENARHIDSESYKFLVKTSGSMKPYIRYKENGYKRCIDYVTSPSVVLTKNSKTGYYMPVVSDNDSITEEKLVIENFQYKKYVPSFNAETSCFIVPVVGNKLHIRVKSKTGFLAQCFVADNTSDYQNKTVKTSEEIYKWHTIDLTTFRETHSDKELKVAIRTLTEDPTNYARLDVFYWE